MKRAILGALLTISAAGQPADTPPKFEIADVHTSPKGGGLSTRLGARAGRYEAKNAPMLDLIRAAYGFPNDRILGGPTWLEMDRFDIVAKLPFGSTPETQKLMLQALLEARFKLVVRKENKPLPTYALTVGSKKLQLKEADGSGDTGCKTQNTVSAGSQGAMTMMTAINGVPTTLTIGPDRMLQYICRNMTMAAFVEGLPRMMGASVGPNPLLDETGLKGEWNFDLKWTLGISGPGIANTTDHVSVFDALDKQLGLKLEAREIPTPVLVVVSANETPSANPPGIAEALPPIPTPTEFEVASIKPSDPASRGGRSGPVINGRFTSEGMPLRYLVDRAFNLSLSDQVVGLPAWADTARFDIIAKTPSMGPAPPPLDSDALAPMLRALLADRFKMTYHSEERPLPAYTLVAAKPKLKRADPTARASCKNLAAPAGSPPASRLLSCQNVTMAQFADRLQNMAQGLNLPVQDATGLEGTWDISLTWSQMAGRTLGIPGNGAGDGAPTAEDPTGGMTLFEALEKQLGLKLEKHDRTVSVIVIDHIEQKPTEN